MLEKRNLETLTFDSFDPLTGQAFSVANVPEPTDLRLTSASKSKNGPIMENTRIPFSLMFKSNQQYVLPQGNYCLSNQQFGEVEIFLVPIAKDNEGVSYQAVFN